MLSTSYLSNYEIIIATTNTKRNTTFRRLIMIYTVTFNPSIDYIMFTDGFELKGLNRARETYKFAGGKGINVSRVLKL